MNYSLNFETLLIAIYVFMLIRQPHFMIGFHVPMHSRESLTSHQISYNKDPNKSI